MSDSDRFDPRFDPAFQRGWDGPAPNPLPRESRPAEPERIVVTAEPEPEREPRASRPNPFLIALTVVALALFVSGLWMASLSSTGFNNAGATSGVDWALLQVLIIGAPLSTLLGVATGIGILFLYAAKWGRDD